MNSIQEQFVNELLDLYSKDKNMINVFNTLLHGDIVSFNEYRYVCDDEAIESFICQSGFVNNCDGHDGYIFKADAEEFYEDTLDFLKPNNSALKKFIKESVNLDNYGENDVLYLSEVNDGEFSWSNIYKDDDPTKDIAFYIPFMISEFGLSNNEINALLKKYSIDL